MKRYIDDVQKVEEELIKCRRLCKCGHSVTVAPGLIRGEYIICTYCGGRMYKDLSKQKQHDKKVKRENFRFNFVKYLKRKRGI